MAPIAKKESALRTATREIVTILGFEDDITHKPIVVDATLSDQEIDTMFNEALGLLTAKDEKKFTPATIQIIRNAAPDLFPPADVVIVKKDEDEAEKPADDLITTINAAERLKDLKAIALANNEFKAIRGKLSSYKSLDDLRDALLETLAEETPEAAAERIHKTNVTEKPVKVGSVKETQKLLAEQEIAQEKKSTPPAKKEPKVVYSRVDSICDALKQNKAKTKDDLAALANTLYVKQGGTDNVKESKATLKYVLPALAAFEITVPTK